MDRFLNKKRKVGDADDVKPTRASKKAKTTKKSSGSEKFDGKTLEQHRRALGDQVKKAIQVEKWCVEAKTTIETTISSKVFERLVIPNAKSVVPDKFDKTTPVVVCCVEGTQALGEIFGRSKIKGGTRLGSWSADRGDVIFFPATGKMRVWWTMS